MRVGVITGTGTYALPGIGEATPQPLTTPYGPVELSRGALAGVEVVHLSRHGPGHRRLSNHVEHRANIAALAQAEVDAVLAVTVCGAVDPAVELGSLIVFDDLHFVSNRLPDGTLCTFHTSAGDRGRGHWIFERPFAAALRRALARGAAAGGTGAFPPGATATSTARASTPARRSTGSRRAASPR